MSEYFSEMEQQPEQNPKRPVMLTVLCVLSFIVIGFGLLEVLFTLIGGEPSPEKIESAYNQLIQMSSDMRDKQMAGIADMLEQGAELARYQQYHFWPVLGIKALTMVTGFFGVLFMLKGRRLGFHLYIIYNLLSVGGKFLIVPAEMLPMVSVIFDLIISGVFILLYSRNLKWMTK